MDLVQENPMKDNRDKKLKIVLSDKYCLLNLFIRFAYLICLQFTANILDLYLFLINFI